MVRTDVEQFIKAFPLEEEREFLFEMVEPALHESDAALKYHEDETVTDVEEMEDWTNIMGRQNRRIVFLKKMYNILERSLND